MNRRHFLATLSAGVAGLALDHERALWTPGQRTHFLPPPSGWTSSGCLLTPALKKGDMFTIDGMFAVNPITGERALFKGTQVAQVFVATDDVSAGVVAVDHMPLYPSALGLRVRDCARVGRLRVQPLNVRLFMSPDLECQVKQPIVDAARVLWLRVPTKVACEVKG